jgi:hypothetical protein
VALWWQVWQENQYFNIFQAKKRVFLAQSHTASNRRSAVFSTQKWRFSGMFHPMEQVVPPHGIKRSTPWNNLKVATSGRGRRYFPSKHFCFRK